MSPARITSGSGRTASSGLSDRFDRGSTYASISSATLNSALIRISLAMILFGTQTGPSCITIVLSSSHQEPKRNAIKAPPENSSRNSATPIR